MTIATPEPQGTSEPTSQRAVLLDDAAKRAGLYLEDLAERGVAPKESHVEALRAWLDQPLPTAGTPDAEVLAEIDRYGSPATVATAGPRFFGFVNGGALPATVAANWLAAAWDQNAFKKVCSPAGTLFEAAALRWLLTLFGLPRETGAAFVTGATMANFTALAAARHALYTQLGWDVEARGLAGAPRLRIVLSEESHPTVRKSLGMLGLGREPDLLLATDAEGRVRADSLPRLEGPTIVCVQAGNVNSGASDPFPALREWCDEAGAWLHIDGAFGLWAAASPLLRSQVEGFERADSMATDAHKWLNVPYDSGIAFVRDAESLRHAMRIDAPYFPAEADRDPFDYTPDSSRRIRGLEIWAALRALGQQGTAELVERCCALACQFAGRLEAGGCEILNDVVLNQVVVSVGSGDGLHERVAARVQAEGTCWLGPTVWQGRSALRVSVSSWATTAEDIDRSAQALLQAVRLEGEREGPSAG